MHESPVGDLASLGLDRPILLTRAARLIAGASSGRSVDSMAVLRAAIQAGLVRSKRVYVPGKGPMTFVEGETIVHEIDTFWGKVGRGELGAPRPRRPELRARARALRRRALGVPAGLRLAEALCFRPAHYVTLCFMTPFAPVQRPGEIRAFVDMLSARRPRRILEIGTSRGGTTYLFARSAHPEALLATVDVRTGYDGALLRSFARRGQLIEPIVGDSRSARIVERIGELFLGDVDVLFIDGDHALEGVTSDFENYAPLVRSGGLIAFHDIVEDNVTRYGIDTGGWSGGVPVLWRRLKREFPTEEFVEDAEQDGAGIGVIVKP